MSLPPFVCNEHLWAFPLIFRKSIISYSNIIIGVYTGYSEFDTVEKFQRNVRYHFVFLCDKLIIGKFRMIASEVTFIMNGANHLTDSVSTYPFAIFGHGWENAMEGRQYPVKGDTVIGNDVWIGYKVSIIAGVTIGGGAIIAANAMVMKAVAPCAIVRGNFSSPVKTIVKP